MAMSECYPNRRSRIKDFDEWRALPPAERERELTLDNRSWGRYDDKWLAWSDPREVDARGICDEWVPRGVGEDSKAGLVGDALTRLFTT